MAERTTEESDLESWREEKSSAWLYGVAAEVEPDPVRQRLFRDLAVTAERQAEIVEKDMAAPPPPFRPSTRARVVAVITRIFKPRRTYRILSAMKVRGVSVYSQPPIEFGHGMPSSVEDVIGRHGGSASGTLRAGVFGINDGLVSNTCLIFGMAGATADNNVVLLTGAAGLLAGAFSMASGEYVSMRSQRELYEHQISQEQEELERYPEEEAEELALIYHARGLPIEQAREMTHRLVKNPEHALNTLAREELGLNPDELGSPWGAAISSFLSFCVGAILPLLPFVVSPGNGALEVSAVVSCIALFVVGATLSLFSGRNAFYGGARMLAIGASAGVATFAIGHVLGVEVLG